MSYEAPAITRIGSIAEVTQGSLSGWGLDGQFPFIGPPKDDPTPTS